MATRMERMESGPSKRHRQCAHMRERIRDGLNKIIGEHNNKVIKSGRGSFAGRLDRVSVSTECVSITGDRVIAELGAKLLRQGGLRDVAVSQGVGDEWTATGVI